MVGTWHGALATATSRSRITSHHHDIPAPSSLCPPCLHFYSAHRPPPPPSCKSGTPTHHDNSCVRSPCRSSLDSSSSSVRKEYLLSSYGMVSKAIAIAGVEKCSEEFTKKRGRVQCGLWRIGYILRSNSLESTAVLSRRHIIASFTARPPVADSSRFHCLRLHARTLHKQTPDTCFLFPAPEKQCPNRVDRQPSNPSSTPSPWKFAPQTPRHILRSNIPFFTT
jgi:hypothetical protein